MAELSFLKNEMKKNPIFEKKIAVVNDSFDFIFRKRKFMRKFTKMYKIQLYLQYLD